MGRSASSRRARGPLPAETDPGPGLKVITLRAEVPAASSRAYASQEELCAWHGVTDRTLRIWAEQGLPVEKGPKRKPRYPLPDATNWVLLRRIRQEASGKAPTMLDAEEVAAWDLQRQAREDPEGWILVPLDLDHPRREALLQRAARGRD